MGFPEVGESTECFSYPVFLEIACKIVRLQDEVEELKYRSHQRVNKSSMACGKLDT